MYIYIYYLFYFFLSSSFPACSGTVTPLPPAPSPSCCLLTLQQIDSCGFGDTTPTLLHNIKEWQAPLCVNKEKTSITRCRLVCDCVCCESSGQLGFKLEGMWEQWKKEKKRKRHGLQVDMSQCQTFFCFFMVSFLPANAIVTLGFSKIYVAGVCILPIQFHELSRVII